MTRKTRRRNKSQGADLEAQPDEGVGHQAIHEGIALKATGHTGSNVLIGEADRQGQAGTSTQSQAQPPKDGPSNSGENAQFVDDGTPGGTAQPISSDTPRMIGDFDDNANAMWSLHLGEAKSHDEARIHSLKDNMDAVFIFAGLFSVALASFLADRTNSLRVDPAQQMVYYQQQNVALLAQISKQVFSIAPQVPIPSTPPPPYPAFIPNPSDVRVNVFWFMSLIFSLSAALLAMLVRQWVRDYMHVFQRYSNPLKSTRLRQYLYEGVEGWYMPVVAESVPGLVHVSLFLFFLGLGDSLLSINTTVGVTTIIPIAICGLMYVLSTFAPVLNPQSPFQNPFSGLIWYLKQKVHPRYYLDRASGGSLKAVSSNLSQGQMQLAMAENNARKDRDVRAIRWLIDNRTEDDEMESFAIAIPGCFTSKWGIDVWKKVSEVEQSEDVEISPIDPAVGSPSDPDLPMSALSRDRSPALQRTQHPLHTLRRIFALRTVNGTPHDVTLTQSMPLLPPDSQAHENLAIHNLCKRVQHLVLTCDNVSTITNKELWLNRARGCTETAASLVFCANMKPEQFGDIGRLLSRIGQFLEADFHTLSAPGSDGLFLARWTCLSFVMVNRGVVNHDGLKQDARLAIDCLSRFISEDEGEQTNNGNNDENALRNAQRIDEYFESARQFCVYGVRGAFRSSEVGITEEQVKEALARDHEADISSLERISLVADQVANIDRSVSRVNGYIQASAWGLISAIRGVQFDIFKETERLEPSQFFNPTKEPYFSPQFIFLHHRLRFLCSYSSSLRDIIDGRSNGTYEDTLKNLMTLWGAADNPNRTWTSLHRGNIMVRQLWRLQDLRDGDGFGFWVELYFLVVSQQLTIPLSPENHSVLILGVFRTITSNWRQHKHSVGTQRVILNLVCDLSILNRGLLSNYPFPSYILDELLVLLGNMVEGLSGSHIEEATKELEDAIMENDTVPVWPTEVSLFREKATQAISRSRALTPSF